jgi:hypothetical protein
VLPGLLPRPVRIHEAVEAGRLSLRRVAALLDFSIAELATLCRDYGRPLSYDLGTVHDLGPTHAERGTPPSGPWPGRGGPGIILPGFSAAE